MYYQPGLTSRPAYEVMQHLLEQNVALLCCRQQGSVGFRHAFCTRSINERCVVSLNSRECTYTFPLYIVEDTRPDQLKLATGMRSPNLSAKVNSTLAKLGLRENSWTPELVLNWIYAVLHSPSYRNRYAEFLKVDFPRIPLTGNMDLFRNIARLGGELISLHIMESPELDKFIPTYTGPKSPEVKRVGWSSDTVWIDAVETKKGHATKPGTIGFQGVPEEVWNFHVGGYQVCEKWLKDRGPKKGKPGRVLTSEDIDHYHKIVVALSETIRIMDEIDEVIEEHGGWPNAFATN